MKQISARKAFTLIELLLTMALLAILAMFLFGNFTTSIKRGRDAQRKNDLSQLQKALELYYDENNAYPDFLDDDIFNQKLCRTDAIPALTPCPTPETTYMTKTPKDPHSSYIYKYVPGASGVDYYLYSYIENSKDLGNGVSQTGYTTNVMCNATTLCKYYVGSSNATPLTPN